MRRARFVDYSGRGLWVVVRLALFSIAVFLAFAVRAMERAMPAAGFRGGKR